MTMIRKIVGATAVVSMTVGSASAASADIRASQSMPAYASPDKLGTAIRRSAKGQRKLKIAQGSLIPLVLIGGAGLIGVVVLVNRSNG